MPDGFARWWNFCQDPSRDGLAQDDATDNQGHPDGAGTTRWGWTLPTWRDARHHAGATDLSETAFLTATQGELGDLARGWFWQRLSCDRMPAGVGVMVADFSFGSGGGIRAIQRGLGVAADGVIGPGTLGAIEAIGGLRFIARCLTWRIAYYDACGFRARWPGLYSRADACAALARELTDAGA